MVWNIKTLNLNDRYKCTNLPYRREEEKNLTKTRVRDAIILRAYMIANHSSLRLNVMLKRRLSRNVKNKITAQMENAKE